MALEIPEINKEEKSFDDLARKQLEGDKPVAPPKIVDDNDYSIFSKLGATPQSSADTKVEVDEVVVPSQEKKGYGAMLGDYYENKLNKKEAEHTEKQAELKKRKDMTNLTQGLRLVGDLTGAFSGANVQRRKSNDFEKLVGESDANEAEYRSESERIQDLIMQGKLSDYKAEQELLRVAEAAREKREQEKEDAVRSQQYKVNLEDQKQSNAVELAKLKAELDKIDPTDRRYKEAVTRYNNAKAAALSSDKKDEDVSNIVGDWGSANINEETKDNLYNEGVNYIQSALSDVELNAAGYKVDDFSNARKEDVIKLIGDALVSSGVDKGEVARLIETGDVESINNLLSNIESVEDNRGLIAKFIDKIKGIKNRVNSPSTNPSTNNYIDETAPITAPTLSDEQLAIVEDDKLSQDEMNSLGGLTDEDFELINSEIK